MKKLGLLLLGLVFILEATYFNIVFDYLLIVIMFLLALGMGGMFTIKVHGIDSVLVKIALGLGVIGFIIWITTFYDINAKSTFIVLGTLLFFYRYKYILEDLHKVYYFIKNISRTHSSLLFIFISALIFYAIPASYPIEQWDALSKHIVVPSVILNRGYNDYNVVESIIFGDYALFVHMLNLFLLTLGGTKALVLLNVIISFLTLTTILRVSTFLTKRQLPLIAIAVLYLTTPFIYSYSTILSTDIYPVFFIVAALLLVQYDKTIFLTKNLPFLALLLGFSFFSKQVAFYLIIPLGVYILALLIKNRGKSVSSTIFTVIVSLGIFFIPFLPSMLLIWYKTGNPLFPFLNEIFQSIYFPASNFQDPYTIWQRFLGFDFRSVLSIVFNTSNNTEYINGGTGLHLLLLPFTLLIWPFMLNNRRFFSLIFLTVGSYWISVTFFNPNIRYFLGAIIFSIPAVIIALDIVLHKFKNVIIQNAILSIIVVIFVYFNINIITDPTNALGFKTTMLIEDNRLTKSANENILEGINRPNIYLLSNNDNQRGTYKGHFYTLTWYNSEIVLGLRNENEKLNFLRSFDYYLIDKRFPLAAFDPAWNNKRSGDIMSQTEESKRNLLEKVKETSTHILYKIIKSDKIIINKNYTAPIAVNVNTPKIETFIHSASSYKIVIDAIPASKEETTGRFQINWLNKHGQVVDVSLSPFKLSPSRTLYESQIIDNIPETAVTGNLYITSHTSTPMKVYGFKLSSYGGLSISLRNKLNKYGKKVVPVYK